MSMTGDDAPEGEPPALGGEVLLDPCGPEEVFPLDYGAGPEDVDGLDTDGSV